MENNVPGLKWKKKISLADDDPVLLCTILQAQRQIKKQNRGRGKRKKGRREKKKRKKKRKKEKPKQTSFDAGLASTAHYGLSFSMLILWLRNLKYQIFPRQVAGAYISDKRTTISLI